MLRQVVRGIGKTLISFGILLFLFVAYQLWGTGLAEARDQRALKDDLQALFRPPPAQAAPDMSTTTTAPARPVLGDAAALIRIPRIGVEKAVVEGVGVEDLKKGPGHYPDTPMPGEPGNAAIAGHRTTYGAPFYDLNELEAGDQIFVMTKAGEFQYDVDNKTIVDPSEVSVLNSTPDNRLTLTTCHPRYSAAQRLIVVAHLVGETVEPPPRPPDDAQPNPDGGLAGADGPTSFEGDDAGLSGVGASKEPVIAWGMLAATVWLGAWALGQQWRRLPAYLMATPVFLVVLFMFYENVARLLPANV